MSPQQMKAFVLDLPGLEIDQMIVSDDHIRIYAHGTAVQGICPMCSTPSTRIHSHYVRSPQDLPMSGRAVRLHLTMKRFRCANRACPRTTFAEPLPDLVGRRQQRTHRCGAIQQLLGLTLGGEVGTQLAAHLRMAVSPDTLLRVVRRMPLPGFPPPRVLGVDDWAWRKGTRYGTVLCDLERGCIIDVLPDREQETLVAWLQQFPEIEIVTRDRSTPYREGITSGAPQAQQVADRWHLLKNLREALQVELKHHRTVLCWTPTLEAGDPNSFALRSPSVERERQVNHARRVERHQQIMALREQRYSDHEIAQRLGISARTVKRWRAKSVIVERRHPTAHEPIIAPYADYLTRRWHEGCHSPTQLWREVQNQGFEGTLTTVRHAVERLAQGLSVVRTPLPPRPSTQRLTPAKAVWIFVLPPDRLDETQQHNLPHLLQVPLLADLYRLIQDFGEMLRQRQPERLLPWMDTVRNSPFGELVRFVNGLEQDLAAVLAALRLEWSNGPVEGHVNRLKLVKRQMYGRARFDLLRARILHPV
jgi:transposase